MSNRDDYGMTPEELDAYAEAEAKWIDSFATEVEAGEWGPFPLDDDDGPGEDRPED